VYLDPVLATEEEVDGDDDAGEATAVVFEVPMKFVLGEEDEVEDEVEDEDADAVADLKDAVEGPLYEEDEGFVGGTETEGTPLCDPEDEEEGEEKVRVAAGEEGVEEEKGFGFAALLLVVVVVLEAGGVFGPPEDDLDVTAGTSGTPLEGERKDLTGVSSVFVVVVVVVPSLSFQYCVTLLRLSWKADIS